MKTKSSIIITAAIALSTTAALATDFTTDTTIAAGNTTYDGQAIVVSNCMLTVNGPHSFASLQAISNGVVTHSAAPNGEADNLLSLTIAGDLEVDALSRIDVSGRGYAAQQGPGAGTANPGGWGRGAGHGGVGGTAYYYGGLGGGAYDSITTPAQWGSGGGSGSGGPGGGAAVLNVAGTLRVDGILAANGSAAPNPQCGGGAGGSLWINAGTLTGGGSITAHGGAGGVAEGGGGGGGGRIALYFTQNTFAGTMSAAGGVGFQNAGAGTLYTKLVADTCGQVLVDNSGNVGEWTPLSTPETFSLIIASGGKVSALAPLTNSALLIQTNGTLSYVTGLSNFTMMVLGNATIDLGGKLDLSGLGYAGAVGPGSGTNSVYGYGSGGGHGGCGGNSVSGGYWGSALGGSVYDSIVSPIQWGSGGGVNNHNGESGGPGGGAVMLNVVGTLQMDGSLTADGLTSPNVQYGGGSGGSLWINAGILTGGGLIAARGGAGGVTAGGGGGGGGRIALYFTQNTFTGTVTAVGGLGFQNGGAGTIYTKLAADTYGQALVDNAGNAGLTRLNSSNWPAGQVFDLMLSGAAIVKPDAPQTFRNLVMTNGAVATHDQAQAGFFWTCLGDAWIASNASFNVDGLGYTIANGPGYGTNSVYGYGSGGGHGGTGAISYNGGYWGPAPGGVTYGSSREPVTLGSGGGGGAGASGGGALRLIVNGTLYLDGTFSANGLDSSGSSGGGAGGSVWITADSLTGDGSVQANGGATAPYGAAGGGGRIAIYTYSTAGFDTNHISTAGGVGGGTGTQVLGYPTPRPNAEVVGSALRLAWHAGDGSNYQVWSSPDLVNWSLYGPVQVGTGGILTQDCPMTNSPGLFFRVQMGD
ncbi:MAG: hypothetical protein ABSE90_07875 [Verrucomicrobiota bacterium]